MYTVHDVLDAMEHLTMMYRTVFNLYVFDNLGHQGFPIDWASALEPRSRTSRKRGETSRFAVDPKGKDHHVQ